MIIDNIKNFRKYFDGEIFDLIYNRIYTIDENHALGEFKLIENDVFYKVLEYKTKENNWITESHQKYVDIQILLSGEEIIRIYTDNTLEVKSKYDLNNDCTFYNVINSNYLSEIVLKKGFFCVFFPQDIHQTQIATYNNSMIIKKLVFKVHEKFFT